MDLNTPIIELNRVGKTIANRLAGLGIKTALDLLFYFPFRYEDYSKTSKIKDLKAGDRANIVGQIELIQNKKSWKKRKYITEALVSDESESIKIIWFNQPFIAKNLKVGDQISLAGKIEDDYGIITMLSPAYEKISFAKKIHTSGLVPVYHLTENISQKQVRFLINQIIFLAEKINDSLPLEIKKRQKLLSLNNALAKIHFPKNQKEADEARKRLAFSELFLKLLKSRIIKKEKDKSRAKAVSFKENETKNFVKSLPFCLTDDQKKSAWRILQDMAKNRPMSRLLNGDVGSGKTIVAVIAMLNTALNNEQAVIMAPTEILAGQHFENLKKYFAEEKIIKIALFTNSQRKVNTQINKKISRKEMLEIIKKGEVDIIVGTQSLVQEDVCFKNLNLAIIDEQHRFGVRQRKALINNSGDKKTVPHFLSMTATPIPRSLSLALFGDLDVSVIRQKPIGRKPIISKIILENERQKIYDFIKSEINNGRQIFVVCPLIEESDLFGVKSVTTEFEKLDKIIFPDIPTACLHGKMRPKEKEQIMRDFLDKKYKILVSTSVVEVGVDIPNASIMMIESAERFGLAQLHQFRGRVGRGQEQAFCFLFTGSKDEKTLKRLHVLENCQDGFALSEMDLKLRGGGEIYGLAQKGFPEFKIATLFDYELITQAKIEAENLIKKDPELKSAPELKKKIFEQFADVHLE